MTRLIACLVVVGLLAGCDYASVTVKDDKGERTCTAAGMASRIEVEKLCGKP